MSRIIHASKFYIGYSRRGNINKVYVQRSKKEIPKVQNNIKNLSTN